LRLRQHTYIYIYAVALKCSIFFFRFVLFNLPALVSVLNHALGMAWVHVSAPSTPLYRLAVSTVSFKLRIGDGVGTGLSTEQANVQAFAP